MEISEKTWIDGEVVFVEEREQEFLPGADQAETETSTTSSVRSLRELIERVTGRGQYQTEPAADAGIAEQLPFPFFAIVGQKEMKLALLLALVNPLMGGVLLVGPRGTGKTTAVRSLVDLLPLVQKSLCFYGCLPEDIESGGIEAVCPDCAKKYAEGQPLATLERSLLVELPLNSRLEDVIGGLDERAVVHQRMRLHRGILAQADRNILYVDEINLLNDDIVDSLLDAATQGSYTVRRGPISATYRSRLMLIGSMNPEEGRLRPQIQDRFGLRVVVHGLADEKDRLEAYRRVQSYLINPHKTVNLYQPETELAKEEIQLAREQLVKVKISDKVAGYGLKLIDSLHIDSLRAEITLFEAARAFSAIDGRNKVEVEDIQQIAPMALRLRRSEFMSDYLDQQNKEQDEIERLIRETRSGRSTQKGEKRHGETSQ